MSGFIQQVRRMIYLECPEGPNHQGEFLNTVCIDENCKQKGVICPVCENDNHKNHQILPLKQLIQDLNNHSEMLEQDENFFEFIQQLEKIHFNSLKVIKDHQQLLNQAISEIEQKINNFYEDIKQKVMIQYSPQTPYKQVVDDICNGKYFDVFQMQQDIQNILKLIEYNPENQLKFKIDLKTIVEQCSEKEKNTYIVLNKLKEQIQKHSTEIQACFQEAITKQDVHIYKFSNKLKGQKINIVSDFVVEQTDMQSNGQRFILIEPHLLKGGMKKRSWGIKVKKFGGWVGVGVCYKNIIMNADFKFNYTNTGHGSYLISSNGYSWSHLKQEYNSAYKCFQFGANDIVYMEFDPILKKLKFKKNQGQIDTEKFELDVEIIPGDEICPCANLCSTNDSVEIINNVTF